MTRWLERAHTARLWGWLRLDLNLRGFPRPRVWRGHGVIDVCLGDWADPVFLIEIERPHR